MRRIPTTAAEMSLPDAPDSQYFLSGAYLRHHLNRLGDNRGVLSEPEFENEFFMRNNPSFVQELAACADTCPFGTFGTDPVSIAPGATRGNSILDALTGVVSSVTPAVASRISGQPRTTTIIQSAPAAKTNWVPIIVGGVVVVGLIAFLATKR